MRIVGGAWRGRRLVAPPGNVTRPTADRVRQALFDMLMHAPWGGRSVIEGAHVLDVFAGTGAMGLEALSRGAATACFVENDPAAVLALRTNVAACRAERQVEIVPQDALRAGRAASAPASLLFLDPPYGQGLVPRTLTHLLEGGVIDAGTLVVAEVGAGEGWSPAEMALAVRMYGAARIMVFRGVAGLAPNLAVSKNAHGG